MNRKEDKGRKTKRRLLFKALEEQVKIKADQGSKRTAKNYRTTIAKIKTYVAGLTAARNVQLHHLDTQWVQDFVTWLHQQHPDTPGTVGFYLSNFKAMYNHAVEQGETTYPDSGYPFAHVSVKTPVPFKRALPQQEIQRLSEKNLYAQLSPACRESLELFLFMFFCQGISFQDLFTLTYNQVSASDYIIYTRSKTNAPLKVKLTDEMKYILQRHRRPDSPYLFPFLHERRKEKATGELNEDSALKRTNRHLKKIGKLLGLEISLTTYVMRHTFATLMLASGATVELISQCLGHTSIKTTQIYLSKLTTEKLDKATGNMLDMYIRQPDIQKVTSPPRKKTQRNKTTSKTEKTCQTRDKEEKKCPSLSKKRTFGDSFVSITSAKVKKYFEIAKFKRHCFLPVLAKPPYFLLKNAFKLVQACCIETATFLNMF